MVTWNFKICTCSLVLFQCSKFWWILFFSGAFGKLKSDFEDFPKLQLTSQRKQLRIHQLSMKLKLTFWTLAWRKENIRTEVLWKKIWLQIQRIFLPFHQLWYYIVTGPGRSPASVSSLESNNIGFGKFQKYFLF